MNIYRVRRNFYDIKGQRGAYFLLENAVKRAKKTKCNVYDEDKNCIWDYSVYLKERRKRNAKSL